MVDSSGTASCFKMDKISLLSYQALVVLLVAGLRGSTAECIVPMNGGLPDFEPLILVPDGYPNGFGFKLPSRESILVFTDGEDVRLVCTGPNNFFAFSPDENDITATCYNNAFIYNHSPLQFNFFGCSVNSNSTTRTTADSCSNDQGHIIEVGFEVSDREFYTLLEICFDEMNLNTLWSKFDLVSAIRDGEVGLKRPLFEPGPHYQGLNPDYLYTRISQRNTIGNIIGMNNADHFIPHKPKDTRLFLSRGHLTASADFVYNVQKYSTYYFINVAPQWHSFNAGTWSEFESAVRFYAYSREMNLIVFTGTHGIATLPDEVGGQQELYLDYEEYTNTRRIPVPALFWKVLYHPDSGKGMVFVGVNNPYVSIDEVNNDPNYQVCAQRIDVAYWDICRRYQAQYQTQGFGYCCEVYDFRGFVNSLPGFDVFGVLQ